MAKLKQTAAGFLVQTLVNSGVRRVYGLAGDSLNALTDEISKTEAMEWLHVRHEEVAAFAAGAEAHLTDKLTVCAGSCGPGNLHLINGLYDCHRSRVPVLAIAAQIPSAELGTGYFQETHPEKLFQDCSHYIGVVSSPDQLPRLLRIAVAEAVNKRGVAVLVIPGDVALGHLGEEAGALPVTAPRAALAPDASAVGQLREALAKAKKVTILAGAGCAGARAELLETARRLRSPVVHALRGKEFVEHDNPYDVGLTGLLGFSSGYHAMEDADFLLMLGTDFPYPQFYPKAKTAQVDSRGEQIGRRTKVDIPITGDVAATLRILLEDLPEKADGKHLEKARAHYQKTREEFDEEARAGKSEELVHPQHVLRVLSEIANADAVFTCDVGTPTIWAARYLRLNGQRRFVGSFNHGSMANALPQGIGAQAAFPKRQVISLSGDGGFSMLMGDLLTLRQRRLPVKTVIFNNSSLGFVELEMKAAGYLQTAVDLENPDFARMAEAVGIRGFRVEKPEELRPALEAALRHDGPVVVDVKVSRLELSMPPSISLEQVKGFGLFAMKAVMSGQGRELVDLAKVNLWR